MKKRRGIAHLKTTVVVDNYCTIFCIHALAKKVTLVEYAEEACKW